MEQKTYSWDSKDYAAHSEAQLLWAQEILPRLGLEGAESVLDIGCGDGKITALLAARVPRGTVTGIDNSAEMIAHAAGNYPPSEYPNLSFVLMDAAKISFNGQFDLAFSNAAPHWVRDQAAMLRGVARALKPGGRIFFQMAGAGNIRDVVDVVADLAKTEPWQEYFHDLALPWLFPSPGEYEGWLRDAGLVPLRVELIPKDMVQDGEEGFAGWMRTTWMPVTGRLPEGLRERFMAEVFREYAGRHPPDSRGGIHIPVARLEAEAEKR